MSASFDIVGFSHIGFAVWDIEKFQETWGTALGMTDWLVKDSGAPGGFQLHGEVIEGYTAARTAFGKVGGTCIELIQPVENIIHHRLQLERVGPSVHHLAFWVEDLPRQLDKASGLGWDIAYSPTSLRPELKDRAVSATATTGWDTGLEYPPFFSFIETLDKQVECSIELIDAAFAKDYHEAYGDYTYYPGDLPS